MNRDKTLIWGIVIGSLLVSLPYALWVSEVAFSDMKSYETLARNLLTRGEYVYGGERRAYRTPGLVFYLAGIYGIVGLKNYLAVRALQCGMFAVLNVILFRAGSVIFGRRVALWGVVLNILSQELIFWAAKPATEFLYTFLLVVYVWLAVTWSVRGGWPRLTLTAFVVGLAALTRPEAAPIAALTAVVMGLRPRRASWLSRTGAVAVFSVVFALTLSPWLVRNWLLFDRLVFNTASGHTLYQSNQSLAGPGERHHRVLNELEERVRASQESEEIAFEIQSNQYMFRKARSHILDHPGRFLQLVLDRLHVMFSYRFVFLTRVPWETLRYFDRIELTLIYWNPVLALAATLGLAVGLFRRPPGNWVLLCVIAATLAVHSVYLGLPRNRISIRPFLNLYVCYGIGVVAPWLHSRIRSAWRAYSVGRQ